MLRIKILVASLVLVLILILNGCSGIGTKEQKTVVELYGVIQVKGNAIVDQNQKPISLHGMSMFWSQWGGKYYNEKCIQWLYNDFNCTVIRAALAVEVGGYLTKPKVEMEKITRVIDECIDQGIYVVVDWHDHRAEKHLEQAKEFFASIAKKYGDKPNIIYEIYNEPLKVSWSEVIKPYSEEVIKVIREFDPDNLIILGTPTWSQDVDIASKDPIKDNNVAYSIHFYTSTHKQELRDKCDEALKNGVALFISEYGTSEANGNGIIDWDETKKWFDYIDKNKLSTCNWAVFDKSETSCALMPMAPSKGSWVDSDLSESGKFNRNFIRTKNAETFKLIGLQVNKEKN